MNKELVLKKLSSLYNPIEQPTEKRLWQVFLSARVCLALVLLFMQLLLGLLNGDRLSVPAVPFLFSAHIAYFCACLAVWVWVYWSKFLFKHEVLLWLCTLLVDVSMFFWLYASQQKSGSFFMLFFFLILMVATLGPRWFIYMISALVLGVVILSSGVLTSGVRGVTNTRDFVFEIFACTALFVVGELVRHLAVRMRNEGIRADKSVSNARQQEGLNRLIVSQMSMGVVIGDSHANLKMINPAAVALITGNENVAEDEDYLPLLENELGWHQLQGVIKILFESVVTSRWLVFDFMLEQGDRGPCALQIKGRLVGSDHIQGQITVPELKHDLCVLFLTDLRDVDKRMRQEKLAAMGRMSASIAHEIRNPLATIGSAATLLSEGLKDPPSLRLTQMVLTNVDRLNRIVKDVLEAAHLEVHGDAEAVDLLFELPNIVSEWRNIHPIGKRLQMKFPEDVFGIYISFDEEHLRRVIVNLLDNALRYASQDEGAIIINVEAFHAAEKEKVRISIYSDGESLDSNVKHALFEPFFSTESRGTGLGLYICRNLCERYGATLDFEREKLNLLGVEKSYNNFFIRADRVDPLPGETRVMLDQTYLPDDSESESV